MRIAREAARLISEHGIRDHQQATSKAATQLGIAGKASLPSAQELEDALREYHRLFRADSHPLLLRQRREAALAAMQFLEAFNPRLVGAVLEGTADTHSAVCVQVFSEDADAVSRYLRDQGVPVRVSTRRVRLNRTLWSPCNVLHLDAGGIPFELLVLPPQALRQAPLAGAAEQPVRRGSISRLQEMLEEDKPAQPGSA